MGKHQNITPAQVDNCVVEGQEQVPLEGTRTPLVSAPQNSAYFKMPMILAETDLQIAVESNIDLNPAASEIKRVKKHAQLDQLKLVPVRFTQIENTEYFRITRAKLFVSGHIHKNIEYASAECNAALQDRIARVSFSGFTELDEEDFYNDPILGISDSSEANFLDGRTQSSGRLDKYFFQNLVKYNEQPYGELVAANFFELDYAPESAHNDSFFDSIREKVVLDLTVKVMQDQQVFLPDVSASTVVPEVQGLTSTPGNGEANPVPEIPNEG